MRIPRSYVEAYSRSLNAISDRARRELESRLSEIDWSLGVAEVRDRVAAIMEMCCGASATMAARLAAEFYDGLRAEFGIEDGYRAAVEPCREPEATEGAVRAFAQDIVDGRPVEQFVGKCSDRLDREVRLAANKCVEHNARRDPKKPRWARVPTGSETCVFCIMLASRGFVYHGEDVASHAHANCDCRVVPSWDKAKAAVEGYDPNECLRAWEKLQEIDRRTDLSGSDKTMLRLAVSDSLHPFNVERSGELVRLFENAMSARSAVFRQDETQESYDRTVGALLRDIGDAYGMAWTGGFANGISPTDPTKRLDSAIPNGEEIWAVTRMKPLHRVIHFPSLDRGIPHGNPDLLVDGRFIDIKTPHSKKRIGKNLTLAATQCHQRGQSEGLAVLSPLNLGSDGIEVYRRTAKSWVEHGRLASIYVIKTDSTIELIP